jgi:hypothetical protein
VLSTAPSREQEPTISIIIKYSLPLALKNAKELMLMLKKEIQIILNE